MEIPTNFELSQYNAQSQSLMQQSNIDAATLTKMGNDRAAISKVAEHFEGMFLSNILQNMFDHIPTDGLMGGGSSEKIWRSMKVQEYGTMLAKNGGVGIADAVERQLMQLQEVRS